jgi:predicted TIM-barrel fold metal-dependent hydrolase
MEITDVNTLFGAYPSRHRDSTAESLSEAMRTHSVDYCLTMSTWGLYYHDKTGNDETLVACRRLKQLIPVATIDPRGYWGQADALPAPGFEMYRFFPHDQGWPVEFAPFRQLLQVLETVGVPIMISVRAPGDVTRIAAAVAGFGQAVILEGVSGETMSEAIAVMRSSERIFMETHAMRSPEALGLLRRTVGIERVLFGSDAPGLSLAAALRYVRGSGLSESDQAMVLGGNADQIWHGGTA